MPKIDRNRLLSDLRTLRTFGATGTGVVRPTLSAIDMEAREWLRTRMTDAGLDASIDGVANVIGRSTRPGPALLIGSHSDTQPTGGWLDGALGVVYGIEVVRAMAEDPETADYAVDAVAWSDEEGTFTSCLGSSSFAGVLDPTELEATNASGLSVRAAIARAGLTDRPLARLEQGRHIGYLEAHIEQGPYLDEQELDIGVVTSIVGIRAMTIEFVGEQNHAGTTPMARRKDAGVALFDFAVQARARIAAVASDVTVWTFGEANLVPGAESIVPGRATLRLQFRDPSDAVLDAVASAVSDVVELADDPAGVRVRIEESRPPIRPTVMDEGFRSHIRQAADQLVPERWIDMPSAAGHDPMVLADHLPCAMLFIPSIGGISHDFAEDTDDDHIALGCQVLADSAASILASARG